MKNIFLTLLAIIAMGCKAQNPILPRYNNPEYANLEGAYYKDINNFHDQFVGTWLYTNGSTSLKVVFKKLMHYKNTGPVHYYEDYLIGEYQYTENGVEKVNTLSNLSVNQPSIFKYDLYNITQVTGNTYEIKCSECLPNEQRLIMGFQEPKMIPLGNAAPDAQLAIRTVVENGVTKMKARLELIEGTHAYGASPDLDDFTVPYGDYILIKQP